MLALDANRTRSDPTLIDMAPMGPVDRGLVSAL
jgi:hypothetical protein